MYTGGPKTGSTTRGRGQKRAKALYDYVATSENDLSFKAGDIIIVTSESSNSGPEWYQGEIGGTRGSFPVNHVEILQDQIREYEKNSGGTNATPQTMKSPKPPAQPKPPPFSAKPTKYGEDSYDTPETSYPGSSYGGGSAYGGGSSYESNSGSSYGAGSSNKGNSGTAYGGGTGYGGSSYGAGSSNKGNSGTAYGGNSSTPSSIYSSSSSSLTPINDSKEKEKTPKSSGSSFSSTTSNGKAKVAFRMVWFVLLFTIAALVFPWYGTQNATFAYLWQWTGVAQYPVNSVNLVAYPPTTNLIYLRGYQGLLYPNIASTFSIVLSFEVIGAFFYLITTYFLYRLYKDDTDHMKKLLVMEILSALCLLLGWLIFFKFGADYFQDVDQRCVIGPCTSFSGTTTAGNALSWGPSLGWICGLVANFISLIELTLVLILFKESL